MQSMLAQQTSEVFIELLVINHDDLGTPIRLCNNNVDVVSNGNTYSAFPFFAALPSDEEDQEPRATVTISNVDQSIVALVRGLTGRPTFTISVVTASTPDTEEFSPHTFEVIGLRGDAATLVFDMTLSEFMQEVFPNLIFSPFKFPSLHKRTL